MIFLRQQIPFDSCISCLAIIFPENYRPIVIVNYHMYELVVGDDVLLRRSQSLVHIVLISWCGCMMTEFSLRAGVSGEYCKVTGGLLWKGNKALLGNKQILKIKFMLLT